MDKCLGTKLYMNLHKIPTYVPIFMPLSNFARFVCIMDLNSCTDRDIIFPVNTKHLYDFMQCWTNVEDVGPTLYKWYTNVLCLLGL